MYERNAQRQIDRYVIQAPGVCVASLTTLSIRGRMLDYRDTCNIHNSAQFGSISLFNAITSSLVQFNSTVAALHASRTASRPASQLAAWKRHGITMPQLGTSVTLTHSHTHSLSLHLPVSIPHSHCVSDQKEHDEYQKQRNSSLGEMGGYINDADGRRLRSSATLIT
ncbi:hypothetical protein BDV95DRAFT_266246 [Massariosphaeria phaeospora]|uniref:Uncharacterized protein n=1 Tax=Massariosphaeria phaeospora TaxID=100035 RepID=A0A7C8M1C1_9PLEO|nr:hypothetical protein BDV95DRAFT_266246 [Massariosphaeria phaeospora]